MGVIGYSWPVAAGGRTSSDKVVHDQDVLAFLEAVGLKLECVLVNFRSITSNRRVVHAKIKFTHGTVFFLIDGLYALPG